MDSGIAQIVMAKFKVGVLKEPRGFMKILQFFLTICAFATTTSYYSQITISVACPSDEVKIQPVTIPLSYPFKLYTETYKVCSTQTLVLAQNFSSDSEFFVAVGVLAFLFTLAALVLYTLFDELYAENPNIPTIDFVAHCIFCVLFFAGSCAWANSLTQLKNATTIQAISAENHVCDKDACSITQLPGFGKLNISIIFGFLNVFLFGSNLWFIYKETLFFRGAANQEQKTETNRQDLE